VGGTPGNCHRRPGELDDPRGPLDIPFIVLKLSFEAWRAAGGHPDQTAHAGARRCRSPPTAVPWVNASAFRAEDVVGEVQMVQVKIVFFALCLTFASLAVEAAEVVVHTGREAPVVVAHRRERRVVVVHPREHRERRVIVVQPEHRRSRRHVVVQEVR